MRILFQMIHPFNPPPNTQETLSSLRLTACFLFIFTASHLACAEGQASVTAYAPHRLIIKFRQEVKIDGLKTGLAQVDGLNTKYHIRSITPFYQPMGNRKHKDTQGLSRVYIFEFAMPFNVTAAVREYAQQKSIEYVQPDYAISIPNGAGIY